MHRRLVTSIALLSLLSGSAVAADMGMPLKAPPPPAATWTGCYINGGGGGGLFTGSHHAETLPGGAALDADTDSGGQGWFGVVGGGCDYQFQFLRWNAVVGAFGDYDFMDLRGTAGNLTFTGDVKESSAWAGGLRAGVLVTPSVLIYTNGGYTGTRVDPINFSLSVAPFTPIGLGTSAQTLNGWFVGGGTETSLAWVMPGLFLRTEYRYSSFESADIPVVTTATGAATGLGIHGNLTTQTVFTELVWRFNFGAPFALQ